MGRLDYYMSYWTKVCLAQVCILILLAAWITRRPAAWAV